MTMSPLLACTTVSDSRMEPWRAAAPGIGGTDVDGLALLSVSMTGGWMCSSPAGLVDLQGHVQGDAEKKGVSSTLG